MPPVYLYCGLWVNLLSDWISFSVKQFFGTLFVYYHKYSLLQNTLITKRSLLTEPQSFCGQSIFSRVSLWMVPGIIITLACWKLYISVQVDIRLNVEDGTSFSSKGRNLDRREATGRFIDRNLVYYTLYYQLLLWTHRGDQ